MASDISIAQHYWCWHGQIDALLFSTQQDTLTLDLYLIGKSPVIDDIKRGQAIKICVANVF